MDGQGKWVASDYMDCGAYGVLDYDNHIIVRSCHGLSKEECTDIAAAHNAALAQARAEERERWMKVIERMAESHTGPVQAALWGVAEMLQRDVTHIAVSVNSQARTP